MRRYDVYIAAGPASPLQSLGSVEASSPKAAIQKKFNSTNFLRFFKQGKSMSFKQAENFYRRMRKTGRLVAVPRATGYTSFASAEKKFMKL
jgi:hypothetical protein